MTKPLTQYFEAIDGTWPAARRFQRGPWTLRQGLGGGSRVSAATANGAVSDADIEDAEAGMAELDQKPLFMIRPGDEALDALLAARGYAILDPVVLYSCPVGHLTDLAIPRVTVFNIWEPLALMREIWAAGGIGPARLAVMDRAKGAKTGFLGRHREQPAGAAFAAIHDGIAMVHAVEILPHQRKQGMGRWFMRAAAIWAEQQGAQQLAVFCTQVNTGANALYSSLGMCVVGQYHYRHMPTEKDPK
ncbi:MAG: GNAT superfamily N-acetyltransferase [Paracoccaceae bacterium]